MRYSIIVIVVLAIFGAAIVLTQRMDHKQALEQPAIIGNQQPQQPEPHPEPTTPVQPSNLNSYSSADYKFSFQYPADWMKYDGPQPGSAFYQPVNYFTRFGQVATTVAIPRSAYPATNFQSAYITFAVDTVIGNKKDCAMYTDFQQSENTANPLGYRALTMTETRIVGGAEYYFAEMGGAAAGTFSKTRIYHVLRNGICYEANLNLFTTNIENYEPGAVTAVDEAAVWQRLEGVLAAVKY